MSAKRPKIRVTCEWEDCNIKYDITQWQKAGGLKRFCSRLCASQHRRKYNIKSYVGGNKRRVKLGASSNTPVKDGILSKKWI